MELGKRKLHEVQRQEVRNPAPGKSNHVYYLQPLKGWAAILCREGAGDSNVPVSQPPLQLTSGRTRCNGHNLKHIKFNLNIKKKKKKVFNDENVLSVFDLAAPLLFLFSVDGEHKHLYFEGTFVY